MTAFLVVLLLFGGSVAIAASLYSSAVKAPLPKPLFYLSIFAAWVAMLSAGAWIILFMYYLWAIVFGREFMDIIPATVMVITTLFGFYLTQFFDTGKLVHFIRSSIGFRQYVANTMLLREESERHRVRRIYRETTGRELSERVRVQRSSGRTVLNESELPSAVGQQFNRENLRACEAGVDADVRDGWILYSANAAPHPWREKISATLVSPSQRILTIEFDFEGIEPARFKERKPYYAFKQQLAEFLLPALEKQWLVPYQRYCVRIRIVCTLRRDDGFGHESRHRFLTIEIPLENLRSAAGEFFDVDNFERKGTVTLLPG